MFQRKGKKQKIGDRRKNLGKKARGEKGIFEVAGRRGGLVPTIDKGIWVPLGESH